MIGRLFILVLIGCWYTAVRMTIYYFFMAKPRQFDGDRFEWWWSWGISIPVSVLSAALILGAISFVLGVGPFR